MVNTKKINLKKLKLLKRIIVLNVSILFIVIAFLMISISHSKETILKKLIKGMDNLNYSYRIASKDGETIVKVIGKKEKRMKANGSEIYIDYVTGKSIAINKEPKYKEEYNNGGIEEMPYYQDMIEEYFNNRTFQYQYLGKKTMDSKKYIVIEFKGSNGFDGKRTIIKLWIDPQVYLIEKKEVYFEDNGNEVLTDIKEYQYHTNENNINEVQIPKKVEKYSSETND